jgi:hypothetical protein
VTSSPPTARYYDAFVLDGDENTIEAGFYDVD